ncbi:hypothetical protein [Pseudomonas sp.]|uniref:hypothetical protein n=1 Tax=Pseudomonas sp. TaxID=306 RepID=UPI0028ACA28C|nr:hypothetical protein [Pseudomonas sp.]
MQTRSLVAEMFIALPTQVWILPVAGAIAYFGLRSAARRGQSGSALQALTYLLLLALAIVPNGLYALMPSLVDNGDLQAAGVALPNYLGRFYLDAFYTFAGWASAWVVRSKFGRD